MDTLPYLPRALPENLYELVELAQDLRWTWSHASDWLWQTIDPLAWELTANPWLILLSVSRQRLDQLSQQEDFVSELKRLAQARRDYMAETGWYGENYHPGQLQQVAYFSMEFGLGGTLPLYAGGLGVLAGDFLKTASDLCIPLTGVGLLFSEGYFRQAIDTEGWQLAAYPHNDPATLPLTQVRDEEGGWLRIPLQLPGRLLYLRVWRAQVGRVALYLLDSNDHLNYPADRGITAKLYDSEPERRLLQEIVLGIGGWRLMQALNIPVDICHLNEGHAAFAVLERCASCMKKSGMSFDEALWATRAGNLFTTHTAVSAAFDTYEERLISQYFSHYAEDLGISMEHLLAMGRNHHNADSHFNMAYLAMNGSIAVNGVSRLHGEVSRRLFQSMFPRWPVLEVPVGHVTNGVHVPTWDSEEADELWTTHCGKGRWRSSLDEVSSAICCVEDEAIWALRSKGRLTLIKHARERLIRQYGAHGSTPDVIEKLAHVLDPNALTLGFARRFATYKRPNLFLMDEERLLRLLNDPARPVQLIVAGKAHPQDDDGKRLLQKLVRFSREDRVHQRIVFLEDYDMMLAEYLVQGVDVWINTPRHSWEACGTSGMKVLVNGGLNLSELDGWWAEAYTPEVGWAIYDNQQHDEATQDMREVEQLYQLLENEVIPQFYQRDAEGLPRDWITRIRTSMACLTTRYSSNRMLRDYLMQRYLPEASRFRTRMKQDGLIARELNEWHKKTERFWDSVHFGDVQITPLESGFQCRAALYCGELSPEHIRVEFYADPLSADDAPSTIVLTLSHAMAGAINGFFFEATVTTSRPREHFSLRAIPYHPSAAIPIENHQVLWH